MSRTIDPIKLKAAAEHLEWVIKQHSGTEETKDLMIGLVPLIEAAKAGEVREPTNWIPYAYSHCNGDFIDFKGPNLGNAYSRFVTEMRGGHTEQERRILEGTRELLAEVNRHD